MKSHHGNRFTDVERLRSPERLAWLEVDRVAALAMAGKELRTALDVGTGTGIFAEAFAGRGLAVAGVDVNPEMLKEARRHVPGADFQPGEAEKLPFPDRAFDLVFLGLVLHETDHPQQALNEAARVSTGRAAVLEWRYQQEELGPGLEERLPAAEVEKLAQAAGFQRVESFELERLVLYCLEKDL